jgi:hypothetical protein
MGFLDFLRGLKGQSGGVPAKTPADLRAALLDVNRSTAPFVVRDGSPEKVDLVVEWHIADAYWHGVFSRSALKKTFKILMRFDVGKHEVRAFDQAWSVEWRPGVPILSPSAEAFQWREPDSSNAPGLGQYGIAWAYLDDTNSPSETNPFGFTESGVKTSLRNAVTAAGWTLRDVASGEL